MSPAGTARVLFAVDKNTFLQSLFAITNPKKNEFGLCFPKTFSNFHRHIATTIIFALVNNSSETKLRQQISGDD